MKYRVTLDGYVIGGPALDRLNLPPIPGTTQVVELDPDDGPGQVIWHGYLQMRTWQEKEQRDPDDWATVKLKSDAPEIDKFREAINIFCRFLAGEGRDNGNQVTKIEPINPGEPTRERPTEPERPSRRAGAGKSEQHQRRHLRPEPPPAVPPERPEQDGAAPPPQEQDGEGQPQAQQGIVT